MLDCQDNEHHTYMLGTKGDIFMTDSDPVSPLSGPILRTPCFMSLQMLRAICGEQREEGTAQIPCLEF